MTTQTTSRQEYIHRSAIAKNHFDQVASGNCHPVDREYLEKNLSMLWRSDLITVYQMPDGSKASVSGTGTKTTAVLF